MKNKKPKSIMIIGKRWFDKVNGNTYCSARVYFDGVEVLRTPWTYGYGNFYEQDARSQLEQAGFLKLRTVNKGAGLKESFYQYCQRNKINYMSEVSDGLKRDMVNWGKL